MPLNVGNRDILTAKMKPEGLLRVSPFRIVFSFSFYPHSGKLHVLFREFSKFGSSLMTDQRVMVHHLHSWVLPYRYRKLGIGILYRPNLE